MMDCEIIFPIFPDIPSFGVSNPDNCVRRSLSFKTEISKDETMKLWACCSIL